MMSDRIVSVKATCIALLVLSQVPASWVGAEVAELMVTLTRGEGYEEFGYDVANVGDVNGDGDPDLLVGAGWSIQGWGRAYLYFGGAAFDTVPDVVFAGEERDEAFAKSLAGAGDLNDDGFEDIIIGARSNDEAGGGAGKAYIYFGGPVVDSLPDVELHGESGDLMGRALAGCGDVNDDGYADVVIGAEDAGPWAGGQARLYFGGSPMDTLVDFVLEYGSCSSFGMAVAGGEDVNADGFPDILVGDPHKASGRAYVFFGGHSLDPVADLVLYGEVNNSHFGFGLAMGDLNGGGDAEVIVGAIKWRPPNESDYGRVYVYRGGEALDDVPDLIVTGQAEGDMLGHVLGASTDLNSDGYRDLCAGALLPDRIFIHVGEWRMDRIEEASVLSPGGLDDGFGRTATFEDLTAEDLPNLVVGAPLARPGGVVRAGAVYVYSLRGAPVEIEAIPIASPMPQIPAGGQLGYQVEATNTTDEPQTFQAWSEVTLPDGFLYEGNPIWGPVERTLAPGDTVVVHRTQPIPPGAPPGQYSWTVRVGPAYPDAIWDTSSFEFKVTNPAR